jgi:hypothetical protein
MKSHGLHDAELTNAHTCAILRLQDEDCRKVQYFLEQVRKYWRPLPDLKLPSEPNQYSYWPINPSWNVRIAPSVDDIVVVARFLRFHDEHIQILAAKALRNSAPEHDRSVALIRAALDKANLRVSQHFHKAIKYLSAVDPGADQWRTRRRSQA